MSVLDSGWWVRDNGPFKHKIGNGWVERANSPGTTVIRRHLTSHRENPNSQPLTMLSLSRQPDLGEQNVTEKGSFHPFYLSVLCYGLLPLPSPTSLYRPMVSYSALPLLVCTGTRSLTKPHAPDLSVQTHGLLPRAPYLSLQTHGLLPGPTPTCLYRPMVFLPSPSPLLVSTDPWSLTRPSTCLSRPMVFYPAPPSPPTCLYRPMVSSLTPLQKEINASKQIKRTLLLANHAVALYKDI